jgi:hypothetical protein
VVEEIPGTITAFPRGIAARCSTISSNPKYLEVRGEYFSSGIWTRRAAGLLRGRMVSHIDLALPDGLASQFTEWLRRHDLHGRKPGFDVVTFDAMGMALARGLQDLVGPSTTVSYAATKPLSIRGWIRSKIRHRP